MHPSRMGHAYLQRTLLLSAVVFLSRSAQVLGQSDKECIAGLFTSNSEFDQNGPCAGLSVSNLDTDIFCSDKCFSAVRSVAECYSAKPDCDPSNLEKYNKNVLFVAEALCAKVLPTITCGNAPAASPGGFPELGTTPGPTGDPGPPALPTTVPTTPAAPAQAPAPTVIAFQTPSPPPPMIEERLVALYDCADGVFFRNGSVVPTGPCQYLQNPANTNQICESCYPAVHKIASCYVSKPACEGSVLTNYTNMVINPANNLCQKASPSYSCGVLPPPFPAPTPAPAPVIAVAPPAVIVVAPPALQPASSPAPVPTVMPTPLAPPVFAPGPAPTGTVASADAFAACANGVFLGNGSAILGGPCSVFVDGSNNSSAVCSVCNPALEGIAYCFRNSPACDATMLTSYIDVISRVSTQCAKPTPPRTCASGPIPSTAPVPLSPTYSPVVAPAPVSCATGLFTASGFDASGPCAMFLPGASNVNVTQACEACFPALNDAFDCYTRSPTCDQSTLEKFKIDILNGVALQCGQVPLPYICEAFGTPPPPPPGLTPPIYMMSPPPPFGSASHIPLRLLFTNFMGLTALVMMALY